MQEYAELPSASWRRFSFAASLVREGSSQAASWLVDHPGRGAAGGGGALAASGAADDTAAAGCCWPCGCCGDGHTERLAETGIGLVETEVNHRRGPWRMLLSAASATISVFTTPDFADRTRSVTH